MMDDAGELADVEKTHHVISTHLVAGLTEVRVYADTHPGAGFTPVDPDIETSIS